MTIKKTSSHILILHRHVGHDPLVAELGDMSVETAIMLEAHHLSENTNSDKNMLEAIMKDRTNHSWLIRAYKAAETHTPKIASGFGRLTEFGQTLTTTAATVMDNLYYHDPNYADPIKFPSPEDWFIQARLPLRAFKMLRMMDQLIESERLQFQTHGPQGKDWDNVVKNVLASTKSENTHSQVKLADGASSPFLPLSPYETDETTNEPQKMDAITIPTLSMDSDDPTIHHTPVVPTGLLGPRGRRDLKQLILLNLVDLRIIRHGGRGRPKQAMTVSPIGQKLVRHEKLFHIK